MRFQVGDKVRIRKDHHNIRRWELSGIEGKIVSIDNGRGIPIEVRWDNERGNGSFNEDSLKLVRRN